MDHAHEKRKPCVEEQVVLDVEQQPRLGQVLDVGVPVLSGFRVGQGKLRAGLVWFGSVLLWFVLFCFDLSEFVLFGLSWFVLIRFGLVWFDIQ